MTAPVFVVDPALLEGVVAGALVRLDGPEGRHAATVRRLTPGEPVVLVDGEGRRAEGSVSAVVGRDALDIGVVRVVDEPAPSPLVVVVQAVPKGDRGELAVELLTEVGVDVIVPWAAAHCVAVWKGDRVDRGHRKWIDAAAAAAKQARRAWFPVVASLATTDEVAARIRAADRAIVLHEAADRPLASTDLPATGEIVLVVGPEGGIAPAELEAFTAAGAVVARLGPTVLRTSSAGIAAVAALLASSERWAVPRRSEVEG